MDIEIDTRVAPGQVPPSGESGARPHSRRTFARVFLAGLAITLMFVACDRAPSLRYPGNGIPHLAESYPITEFNQSLMAHFGTIDGIRVSGQTLLLSDATAVRFDSAHPIVSRFFAINIPIHVSKGECRISLGGVSLDVSPGAASIIQVGADARHLQGMQVKEVNVHVTPRGSGAAIYGADGRMELIGLAVKVPAELSIECGEHTSAVLGPWSWIRGME